ncbi:hypothetical protein AAE478_001159 [Parahypoxylon ruwenzoriense]
MGPTVVALVFFSFLARTHALSPYSSSDHKRWVPWNGGNLGDSGSSPFTGEVPYFGAEADFDIEQARHDRTVHGILAAIAFAVLFPLGAFLMRTVPGRRTWIVHAATQVVALALYIAAAGIGIMLVSTVRIPPDGSSLKQQLDSPRTNAHPIIGIVVLVLVVLQPALGLVHHARFKARGRRTGWSHAHLWVGRCAIVLGAINGGLGLKLADASRDVIIAYAVVAGVMCCLWLVAAVVGEMRRPPQPPKGTADGSDFPPAPRPSPAASRARMRSTQNRHSNHQHHRRNLRRDDSNSSSPNDPSPPYSPFTPGPLYGGPPVHGAPGQRGPVETRPLKEHEDRRRGSTSHSS